VGYVSAHQDVEQVHSLVNPFSSSARGSKLPDVDSSRSVPISIVTRNPVATIGSAGVWAVRLKPSLANWSAGATTITGSVVTTLGAASSVPDYTALASQFIKYRIVSWGFKIYCTLPPTEQAGQFQVITDPDIGNGADTASSFYEENLTFPNSEQTVQWVSKPIGNQYLNYIPMTDDHSWDEVLIYASGLSNVNATTHLIETFYNIECQVMLGQITAAIATPAADHKPHVLAAVATVHKKSAGARVGAAVKAGLLGWIKGALGRAANIGMNYVGSMLGSKTGMSLPQLTQYGHIPMVD
jgi:hypothetical protein